MSDLFKCGFCDLIFGLLSRVMCARSRRGSSDTCYRELGGRNTVRVDVTSSSDSTSDPTDAINSPTTSSFPEDCSSRAKISSSADDDTSRAKISSLPDDDTSTGRRTFEEELAKILKENVTNELLSTKRTRLGAFCTIKRQTPSSYVTPEVLDDCYPKQAELLLSRSGLWDFDTFHLDQMTGGHCLPALGMHLFLKYELINHFNLNPEHCWKLFHLIESNYHSSNPYHNSIHASDVTQAIHCFLQQPQLLHHLRKIEILVVLLAALTHDLDHPGVNQSYLVATRHPLAVIYNENALGKNDRSAMSALRKKKPKFLQIFKKEVPDNSDTRTTPKKSSTSSSTSFFRRKKKQVVIDGSILECHHWRVAYACIVESRIFVQSKVQLRNIKKMLKELILATDINYHKQYIATFRTFMARKLDMSLAEHRLMVLQIALKTADISNPGRPWKISRKWSEKVCDEFFSQGDNERKRKIPISQLCDREQDTIPAIQIGFFQYVVKPLYTEWHRYLRTDLSLKIMTNLVHNAAEWNREAQRSCTSSNEITPADQRHYSLSPIISASTESLLKETGARAPLLQPRRSSYSPVRVSAVKDALRRFSAPLHALVVAPRVISEVLLCEEQFEGWRPPPPADYNPSASHPQRRSAEEIRRSRTLSRRQERRGSDTQERSLSPLPSPVRPAGATPTRASIPPPFPEIELNGAPRTYTGFSAKDGDSTNGVEKIRFGTFVLAECDSDSRHSASTSGTITGYPHLLSTVTGSVSSPSTDSRLFTPMTFDNASCAVGSSEAVVQHATTREECCDVLARLIPELTRRRGSAPIVTTLSPPQPQSARTEPKKLSASFLTFDLTVPESLPPVRRGSLPVEVMTGISAL